jgi:hypothetical protein
VHSPADGPTRGSRAPTFIEGPRRIYGCEASLTERVGRIRQDLSAGLPVAYAQLRQYARDCGVLMELAYRRYVSHGIGHEREAAVFWMHQAHEALRALSPTAQALWHAAVLERAGSC